MLNKEEQNYLLELVKNTITLYLEKNEILKIQKKDIVEIFGEKTIILKDFGCFVTLHTSSNDLRGCIGIIVGDKPLYQNVINYAIQASTKDPRFPKVSFDEFKTLNFEVSVMGEIRDLPIDSFFDTIEIGKHGLIIRNGFNQGLLLPQVATEWKMDQKEFLQQTCNKAGLPRDAYEDSNTIISYFEAFVFS